MENNPNVNPAVANQQEEEVSISIKDIIFLVLNNWYWFVISVTACLIIAAIVYKTQPKVYQEQATILVRDNSKNNRGASKNMDAIFNQMGMNLNDGISIENEMYIIKSSPLMMNVVNRLGLTVGCSRNTLFHKESYYRNAPLELNVFNRSVDSADVPIGMTVTPKGKDIYMYRIVRIDKDKVKGEEKEARYNQIVRISDNLSFSIDRTESFSEELHANTTFDMSYTPSYNVAKGILARLEVTRVDKMADILNLSITDRNEQRAQDILDTLIAVYNEDVINDKNKVAQKTENFIDERIALISGELRDVDSKVESLYKSSRITDLASASGTFLESSTRYNEEVVRLETELTLVKYIKDYVTNPDNKDDLIPANVGVSDAGVQNMISTYNKQMLSYQKLKTTAGANNPTLRNTESELSATRAAIIETINNLVNSTDVKLKYAREQEAKAQRQITDMPTQTKAVTEVGRQQKIKEELYLYLLNKREENALTLAITVANAKVVESANRVSVSPRLMMYALVSLVLGLALPVVVIFCINFFNHKIRSRGDVERALSVPILGEIPTKPENRAGDEIQVTATGNDRITESFRILHSNLPYFMNSEENKVVQFVSTTPGEGKSYVSLNMALSLAFLGKKTCLVDLDLRKRTTSKEIDRYNNMGIIHYLLGKEDDIDKIITRSEASENLHYIVCEKVPPNATQLLLSDKFPALVAYLRERYDYVLFYSAPAQVGADFGLINRYCDLTAYVMRIGVAEKASLPFVQELHDKQKFKNMAIILTDVPILKKRYGGYGYGYGSGYGYGYGYGYGSGGFEYNDATSKRDSKRRSKRHSKRKK